MSSHEELINLVIALREAQKAELEKRTHQNMVERQRMEMKIDRWILGYMAECAQLDLWTRSTKGSEIPGAYNIASEAETKKEGGT